MPISAIDCVQPALQHTRDQLFRPFRFGQWSRLALVGILAAELHTSGCNFNGLTLPSQQRRPSQEFLGTGPFSSIDPARIAQFAGLIAAALVLGTILFFIFLYFNSVFRFILFDSVVKKRCSISEGWARWHQSGRRYFLWQIVLMIASVLFFAVLIGVPLVAAATLGWFRDAGQHMARTVIGVVALIGLFFLFALMAAVVQVLARDFLVPIMALENVDFVDGWSRLFGLMRLEPARYVVYLLLKIVLAVAAAIVFGLLTLVPILVLVAPAVLAVFVGYKVGLNWNVTTVSIAIIAATILIAVLVYLVALISVPATVFFPAFSIYFFASRYPKLDALLNPPPPAPELRQVEPSPSSFEPPRLPPSPEPIG